MITSTLKWIIILAATLNFGYMLFDGSRALILGDYIRPSAGTHAGQLGPWSGVVRSIGIDPESTLMKAVFLIWGLTGLAVTLAFGFDIEWAWKALLAVSLCSVWYLGPGTVLSILQAVLLVVLRVLD
jgi:hypothetical protein